MLLNNGFIQYLTNQQQAQNKLSRCMAESDVLSKLERYQEALAAYEQVIALDPTFAGAYEDKGDSLLKLGRYEEALTGYKQAIRATQYNAHVCSKADKY